MVIEILKDELVINGNIYLQIDNNIFQHLIDLTGDASKCKIYKFPESREVLLLHGFVIHHEPLENLISTIHCLFEELDYEHYDIVDRRKGDDLIC